MLVGCHTFSMSRLISARKKSRPVSRTPWKVKKLLFRASRSPCAHAIDSSML